MSILAQSIYNSTGFTIGRRDSWTERTNQMHSSKKKIVNAVHGRIPTVKLKILGKFLEK